MIYILTGAIRTGKTTALIEWSKTKKDVDGLLCPDDENGKRYFLKVKSKEEFELEIESKNDIELEKIIEIGSFQFLKSAFKKANEFLEQMLIVPARMFLIIDELGKLELRNKGLHHSAEQLIPKFMNNSKQHLILVVRTSLLEEIIGHYQIKAYTLITKSDLTKNSLA
ncbi:nucleoside-triphosphatase [Olleya sp. R77988]|uniref:nucleoside-triphosphatase n=1 Tax=Olleya sp. R77988 TaxID=3093875 RepID=UPI0037C7A3A3